MTIQSRAELVMRRRVVRAFILADAVRVSFTRRTLVETPAGGWVRTKEPTPLAPQVARLVPSKRRYAPPFVNTEEGEIPKWPYILLGYHDMDVQERDTFEIDGKLYEAKSIEPRREERTVVAVDYYSAPAPVEP